MQHKFRYRVHNTPQTIQNLIIKIWMLNFQNNTYFVSLAYAGYKVKVIRV